MCAVSRLRNRTHPAQRNGRASQGIARRLRWQAGLRMPTVLRTGLYRIYFFSHETTEPPHVHVDRERSSAKFWLHPNGLARNLGFSVRELRRLQVFDQGTPKGVAGGMVWVFWPRTLTSVWQRSSSPKTSCAS